MAALQLKDGGIEGMSETAPADETKAVETQIDDTTAATADDEPDEIGEAHPDGEPDGDETEEGEPKAKKSKSNSKPAAERIAEERWKRGESDRRAEAAERRAAELEARIARLEGARSGEASDDLKEPDPNDYEFGAADPQYLRDCGKYDLRLELAERDKTRSAESAEQAKRTAAQAAGAELDAKWGEMQTRGAEKYSDFADKMADLKVTEPLLAVAIQSSPVGDDAAYHLAVNPHEAELITARLATGDVLGAAERFGAIEGGHMTEAPERPTNGNPLDLALYAGRLRGFLARENAPKPVVKPTGAPAPSKDHARGTGGQFESGERAMYRKMLQEFR